MATITPSNCSDSPSFCQWWNQVENTTGNMGWDEGIMLEILVEQFNSGATPEQAGEFATYEYEVGQGEAWADSAMHRAYSY